MEPRYLLTAICLSGYLKWLKNQKEKNLLGNLMTNLYLPTRILLINEIKARKVNKKAIRIDS